MEAALGGFELGDDARSVVCSELFVAYPAWPGAHGVVGGFERDGFEAAWVVWSYGAADNVEKCGAGGPDAESALSADHGGSEVEGVTASSGMGIRRCFLKS